MALEEKYRALYDARGSVLHELKHARIAKVLLESKQTQAIAALKELLQQVHKYMPQISNWDGEGVSG